MHPIFVKDSEAAEGMKNWWCFCIWIWQKNVCGANGHNYISELLKIGFAIAPPVPKVPPPLHTNKALLLVVLIIFGIAEST